MLCVLLLRGPHVCHLRKNLDLQHTFSRFGLNSSPAYSLCQIIPWGDKDSLAAFQRKNDVDIVISGMTASLSAWARSADVLQYTSKSHVWQKRCIPHENRCG